MKTPIRSPFVNPRWGPPYPASTYNSEIDRLAAIPGTPQFRYRNGVGIGYRAWRGIDVVAAVFRSRSPLWWLTVFGAILFYQFLRLTIFSDNANAQWNGIVKSPPPSQKDVRRMMDLKH